MNDIQNEIDKRKKEIINNTFDVIKDAYIDAAARGKTDIFLLNIGGLSDEIVVVLKAKMRQLGVTMNYSPPRRGSIGGTHLSLRW